MLMLAASLHGQQPVLPLMPPIEAGVPAFLLQPPADAHWTVGIPAAPMFPPVIAAGRLYVTTLPGLLAARDIVDGHELWRADLIPDQQVATDDTHVYVAGGEAVHALDAKTGARTWRTPTGTLTAPPVAKDGWVIVTPARRIVALRAADGSEVWSRENALQRERVTISGDILIVPLRSGVVQALDLRTGKTLWERRVGGIPAESLVVGDRLYLGATDKMFYCLKLATGEFDWRWRVGAEIRGSAAADAERVYFAGLDNVVRAVDRISGAQRWQQGVPFRPLIGPQVAAGVVLVAGPVADVRLLNVLTGAESGKLSFPDPLATAPAIAEIAGSVLAAGITGGLNESWKLILVSQRSRLPSFPAPSTSR
jgi:outer membrane protein assembly factor BamB